MFSLNIDSPGPNCHYDQKTKLNREFKLYYRAIAAKYHGTSRTNTLISTTELKIQTEVYTPISTYLLTNKQEIHKREKTENVLVQLDDCM